MRFEAHESPAEIHALINAVNDGRFRFKKRSGNFQFGSSFAATTTEFSGQVYLEWQIGYDVTIIDVTNEKKNTSLTGLTFTGANGEKKHPYELSELLFEAVRIGLVRKEDVVSLSEEAAVFTEFLDRVPISVGELRPVSLNGLDFKETTTALPTYFLPLDGGVQIEVSVQKQQYAAGIQPMLYLCVPISAFANGREFLGLKTVSADRLDYVIDVSNADVLLGVFRVFAMCSAAHNHDVHEILKAIVGR